MTGGYKEALKGSNQFSCYFFAHTSATRYISRRWMWYTYANIWKKGERRTIVDCDSRIVKHVHLAYWNKDLNCANTTLECLSSIFETQVDSQLYKAAVGLHGAGGYRAQCGLVEGVLLFIGLYSDICDKTTDEAVALFMSLRRVLRKNLVLYSALI